MQVRLVLAALRKHRLITFLISLQISFACAVLCNACFLIVQRVEAMHIDTGVDEGSLGIVKLTGIESANAGDLNARVVDALRRVPGAKSVSVISAVPFGDTGIRAGIALDPDWQHPGGVTDFYVGDATALATLGSHIILGRRPAEDEYSDIAHVVPNNPSVLIPARLAEHLWPAQNPIGKEFWGMDTKLKVIGILDHLAVSMPGGGEAKDADWSVFVPAVAGPQLSGVYAIRASRADLPRVMRDAKQVIIAAAPDAVLDYEQSRTLTELRTRYFKSSWVMVGLLAGVIVALLGTTALSIVGLASFWVTQRRKQVGTRRALGASRGDILRYFQVENFLIVTFGIAIGLFFTYGLNFLLMQVYELPRLPIWYLPLGAIALWILGQLAVLAPALRASSIAPIQAIRTV